MKIILCQVSNKLINPPKGSLEEFYFNSLYSSRPGYFNPVSGDFWEIPLCIARASKSIPGAALHIVKDVQESIDYLNQTRPNYVLFSVLEVNKELIKSIILACPKVRFICGGYINKRFFQDGVDYPPNFEWFDSLQAGLEDLGF